MLTVFGYIRSGDCLKVKWMLDRPGRDCQWVEMDILSGAGRTPEFLARNPSVVADLALVASMRAAHEGGFDPAPLTKSRAWVRRAETAFGIETTD